MEISNDFRELLLFLNGRSVEYVIVGGYAMAHHGSPRYTGDLDIMVRSEPENAVRIMEALNEFGFGLSEITTQDFLTPGRVVQLGFPPWRIDLINEVSGVSSEQIFRNKESGEYGDVPTYYIDLESLLANKLATDRPKDQGDIATLRRKKGLSL